ncbi:MAG TPA: sulfatase [Bryobacteraceae bacterium]|nr:sulfatase [Bryobacteraceae bacterium]
MMNRREVLKTLGGGVACAAAGAASAHLNVVFILMDDLGWADIGCYGSRFYETPNLDRLARQSVRFTNAYAACPVCSPTRASILTGKYPARLGLTNYLPGKHQLPYSKLLPPESVQFLAPEEITIAEAVKPAGYATASIGKWHLGPTAEYWPERQGFDVNIGGSSSGMPKSFFYPAWEGNPPIKGREGEYLTDRLTDEAVRFMKDNRSRPFFLYLPHYAVHVPIEAKKELIAKYKSKVKPGQFQNDPIYAAMIQSMDESVGRIMATLDELGIADRTVVFFNSDNGGLSAPEWKLVPVTSNAPLREGKGHVYEGGIREPLIVRWPGVKPRVEHTAVCSIDFLPTIIEAAGLPGRPDLHADGLSLAGLIKKSAPLPPRALYWHYPHYSNQLGKPAGAVRQGDFKLIEFYEDGRLELYNLKNDIGERHDLAREMPGRTRELHGMLTAWRRSVNAKMPTPNPKYDPARAEEGYWWREGTAPK